MGEWARDPKEACRKQFFEVQTWRQVRGSAVMLETRDSGTKCPQRHTVMFEGQEKVDMRVACPQDVKKMHLKQAKSQFRKKWQPNMSVRRLAGSDSDCAARKTKGGQRSTGR